MSNLTELSKQIVDIVNKEDNDYDAADALLKFLENNLPKTPKVTIEKDGKCYIAMKAGTMEMRITGVYDSKDSMMMNLKESYGIENEEDLQEWIEDGEFQVTTSTFYKTKIKE